ncbi:MAG TPA: cation:proton antiporter [Nitrolancea sp.]|jgi:NhaP-type Na+/H+ or K+/H+ antiporter|nr:cation:proton antiporter [Nitrolancea sp.]
MPSLIDAFALFGVVLLVAPLVSGLIQRAPISFPIIFLGLGVLLGNRGFGVLSLTPHDKSLEVVATLTLALVLFIDALKLRLDEVGEDWVLPILTLGPGTICTIALVTIGAHFILGFSMIESVLMGSILASTDPVVLRDILRDERIPRAIRRTLGVEAGTNDIVVLPTVLILIAIANSTAGGFLDWGEFLLKLLILGPIAGAVVGASGGWAIGKADQRFNIGREYQALYGIGLVLVAYVAGVQVGGDGFLAAFAAGLTVTALEFELCDCFLDYGDVTAEMLMFLAFVLFGAVISSMSFPISPARMIVFAVVVIAISRPIAMWLVLRQAQISQVARRTIGWFGPRGLSSLLFALLVIESGLGSGERILSVVGIVVMISVLVHGVSATPLGAWYGRQLAEQTLAEERETTAIGLFRGEAGGDQVPRISVDELARLLDSPDPPIVLDVRTHSQYAADGSRIPGSIRVAPDHLLEWIDNQEQRDRLIVAYCT